MSEVDKHYGADVASRPHGDHPGTVSEVSDDVGTKLKNATNAAARLAGTVKGSAKETYGAAADWAAESYDSATRNVTYARRRSAAEFNRGRRTVEDFVEENPIMVGVVGLAAGLLLGALIPSTRRENQYFGRYADEVRNEGYRYAHDVVEQGRTILEENLKGFQTARNDGGTAAR